MVPDIPSELFRVLSNFSCLATWSNWSFPKGEGVAFLRDSYKLGTGPSLTRQVGAKNSVNTGDRFTDPHSKKPSKRVCDLRSFPHNPTVENTNSHL